MSTDLSSAARLRLETLFPIEDLARDLHVHDEIVLRWIKRGRGGRKLDAVKKCGQWYTSLEALERYRGEEQVA